MHMMRSDSPIFENFGEIYFSTIYHGSIKAWHLHKEATLNYACVFGKVKLILFDERLNYLLKKSNKTNIWNGFFQSIKKLNYLL